MAHRDRATGWQHAKLSGHKNEDLVKELLDSDRDFQQHFLNKIDRAHATIKETSIGGLHETNVPSVNGRKTKSKTDLKVYLSRINTFGALHLSNYACLWFGPDGWYSEDEFWSYEYRITPDGLLTAPRIFTK